MKMRHFYLVLSVVGVLIPNAPFYPWVARHGLDAVSHEPQQRPLDADQPDPAGHIHDARLRPKPQ